MLFRSYVAIHRGMSEGEFITIAGEPDLLSHEGYHGRRYFYLPSSAVPCTTTVVSGGGPL